MKPIIHVIDDSLESVLQDVLAAREDQNAEWGTGEKSLELILSVLAYKMGAVGLGVMDEDDDEVDEALIHLGAFVIRCLEARR